MTIRFAPSPAAVAVLGLAVLALAAPTGARPAALAPAAAPSQRSGFAANGHLDILQSANDSDESAFFAAAPWRADAPHHAAAQAGSSANRNAGRWIVPQGTTGRREVQVMTSEIYDGVIPLDVDWTFQKDNGFGAIAASEDTLVVLAGREKTNPLYPDPENGAQAGAGAIHFFEKRDGRWQRVQKLEFPPEVVGTTALFGRALAVSGDTLLIGAPRGNVAASRPGKVYVYRRVDGVWRQTQILTDGVIQNSGSGFGSFIAVQGERALIADVAENGLRGAVYAFARSGDGSWAQTQRLTLPDPPEYAQFGAGLALDGSTALITANMVGWEPVPHANPVVHVHQLDPASGEWSEAQSLTSCGLTAEGYVYNFGYGRMALDGDTAVIADTAGSLVTPDTSEQTGIVCVFTRSNGTWTGSQALTAPDAASGDLFGLSFALKGDRLAIGSARFQSDDPYLGNGIVYVFDRDGSAWNLSDRIVRGGPSYFHDNSGGIAVAAIDGSAVVSASGLSAGVDFGAISVFDFPAQPAVAPAALTVSVIAGAQISSSVRVANTGAGSALDFSLSDGTTLTQISDEAPIPGMGIGMPQCRLSEGAFPECVEVTGSAATSWYRRFYFGEHPQVGASATIDAVSVGIEGSQAGVPVSVKLYTKPHDDGAVDTLDSFQLEYIGGGSAITDGTPHSLLRVPIDGTATVQDTAFEDLVVEYHIDDHPGLPVFVPGANASPQTHSTFITSFRGDFLYAGQSSHILISPHLNAAASGIRCATPANTPWLAVAAPSEGRVEAGSWKDLAVSIDASQLAPGHYSSELCVAGKGPLPSLLRVPVELTVLDAGDVLFRDGFDGAQR